MAFHVECELMCIFSNIFFDIALTTSCSNTYFTTCCCVQQSHVDKVYSISAVFPVGQIEMAGRSEFMFRNDETIQ